MTRAPVPLFTLHSFPETFHLKLKKKSLGLVILKNLSPKVIFV